MARGHVFPSSLTKYFGIFAVVEGYFGLIFNNQPAKMIVVEMGRSSLSKVACGLKVEASNTVDEAVDVANTTNKLDELAVAKGRAKGHVVAKGRAKGHVVAKCHVVSVDCVNDGFLYSLMKHVATSCATTTSLWHSW
jgi:hypothetical protein